MPFDFITMICSVTKVKGLAVVNLQVTDIIVGTVRVLKVINKRGNRVIGLIDDSFAITLLALALGVVHRWFCLCCQQYNDVFLHRVYKTFESVFGGYNIVILNCCRVHKILTHSYVSFFEIADFISHLLRPHFGLKDLCIHVDCILHPFFFVKLAMLSCR